MAILGSITINEVSIAELDASPVSSPVDLPVGSIAVDTFTGILYTKTGALSSEWTPAGSGSSSTPGGSFVFQGSVTVNADAGFAVGSLSSSVTTVRDVFLEVNGSVTVSTDGRIVVGPSSSALVRST